MTSRARAVTPSEAVTCRVLAPHLIYDQTEQRQVGAGALVLVHPGAVKGWVRNKWCEVAGDDPTEAVEADEPAPAESVAKAPTAPRRRAGNTKSASGK
ncbi:hypothetical protein CH298_23025 [Rhodococcoides fascians]|uniref:hypothetical protein n=1 Tax=Rhodococcoides fascians TaxID=1828 RepID=UPI000B9AC9C6|nr:hypothetical protein [Rhodococcus fascians]OZE85523.1 hypothetical protein CH303_23380 [Rhodococcus fascians]OZF12030.1 hypothetical protein CH298_23025 [Rhodococcus fascians]OZF14798.1 hypothetical protein CH297_23405 [Rhodococcus fascians]OZF61377.1 hypothetical protein CH308_23025 [Rhodococcus fascians]OZF64482.1 hypothetical protein CH307_23220 [Rhodococcus fascians]